MRDYNVTLPSPTELASWQRCQTEWAFKYGLGWHPREKGMGYIVGSGLSDALAVYYWPQTRLLDGDETADQRKQSALYTYSLAIANARTTNPTIPDEEWLPAIKEGNAVLQLYVNTYPHNPSGWEILGVQYRLESPAAMVLDMLVRDTDSELPRVVETKSISPFADLDFEMERYEMGWQPITYCVGAEEVLKEPVSKVTMEFLVKGAPAKRVNNRNYKAVDPQIVRRNIEVEEWKKAMWQQTATYENYLMLQMAQYLREEPDMSLTSIPKKTSSCVYQLGRKTYRCPFYAACSTNMHPEAMPDLYVNKRLEGE